MEEIFRDTQEQIDTFYRTMIALNMQEWKEGKGLLPMTIDDAEFLYQYGIATIFKNGKLEFMEEENGN